MVALLLKPGLEEVAEEICPERHEDILTATQTHASL